METRFLSGGTRQVPGPTPSQPSSLLDHTVSSAAEPLRGSQGGVTSHKAQQAGSKPKTAARLLSFMTFGCGELTTFWRLSFYRP